MRITTRSICSNILLLFLLPGIAFGWGDGFSSTFSSGSTPAITVSSSSFQSVSYSSSGSTFYSTAQTFSIPQSFQAIISKFDITQAVIPSEATIQQGLQESLTFLNNTPLEGNDYKAAIIQPIMNLLLSGNYSAETRDLALSNLYSIAANERIDYAQKSDMAYGLIEYMENVTTEVQNGLLSVSTVKDEFRIISGIIVLLLDNSTISAEEQMNILVSVADNEILNQALDIKNTVLNVKCEIYQALVANKNYPLYILDSSNKDRGKLSLAHILEKSVSKNSDSGFNLKTISCLNALLKDSLLSAEEVNIIKNTTSFVLENRTVDNYSLKTKCLSTLMNLSEDSRLTETERKEVKDLITAYGLTDSNQKIYEDTGVLLLAADSTYYNLPAADVLTNTINTMPEEKRAKTILLDEQLLSGGEAGNIVETDGLIGLYSFRDDIITIKMGVSWYTADNYASTLYHETTHYLENNVLTAEQKSTLQSIWEEADDSSDFTRTLGMTNRSEYLATTAEAVLMEYTSDGRELLERAQQQAANGNSALLRMYLFVEEIWGLS